MHARSVSTQFLAEMSELGQPLPAGPDHLCATHARGRPPAPGAAATAGGASAGRWLR